jgi:hypothetical protein
METDTDREYAHKSDGHAFLWRPLHTDFGGRTKETEGKRVVCVGG